MKIEKTGNTRQDNCIHEFTPLGDSDLKTIDGYYKDEQDYKEGEMYQLYICKKCSRIVSVDFSVEDDSPIRKFEKEFKIVKERKR